MMRVGLVQLNASDDPAANLVVTERLVREAAAGGARLVLTPETTIIISSSRSHQQKVLHVEAEDPTLARLRELAAELGIWLSIGSLALKSDDGADERFLNRQFLIDPTGAITARYDKIHMFDVDLDGGESYRESEAFRPGASAVLAKVGDFTLGLTICYDLRFPALHRALALAGAGVLTVPAAFTVPTGRAHWEVLLRARAIETGSYVLAAAQWGKHPAETGRERETWGHSLAIDPWGRVLSDGGEGTGVTFADLDPAAIGKARPSIPALANARDFSAPVPVGG